MAEKFVGKWKLSSSENFDEFMKKLGVGFVMRKLGNSLKPTLLIQYGGEIGDNRWKITSVTSIKSTSICFELNKEFDEETHDGIKVKSIVTLEPANKLVHTQRENGKLLCSFTRFINENGEQIVILKADDIEAKRVFHRC